MHGLVVDLGDEFGSRIVGTDTCPICDGTGEEPACEPFDVIADMQAEWLASAEDETVCPF